MDKKYVIAALLVLAGVVAADKLRSLPVLNRLPRI